MKKITADVGGAHHQRVGKKQKPPTPPAPNIGRPGEARRAVGAGDVRPAACSPKVSLIGRHYRGRALEPGGEQAVSRRGRRLGRDTQSGAPKKRKGSGAHRNSPPPATGADPTDEPLDRETWIPYFERKGARQREQTGRQ